MDVKKTDKKMLQDLYEVIASLETADDCRLLFEDLCTFKELDKMAQRIRAARLLLKDMTYAQVRDNCDISSATLSRVSHCVKYGEGYSKFLK